MKRIFTLIAIAVGLILPMQAQQPIKKELKANRGIERKMMRKATAANITITDIVGTYDAHAVSAFENTPDEKWTVTITADETEANKVWIHPVCMIEGAAPNNLSPVYATFDEGKGTLTMPLGQTIDESAGQYKLVTATTDDGSRIDTSSDVTIHIAANEDVLKLSFAEQGIFGVGDILNKQWWYQAIYNVTFTKSIPVPYVYIYNKGEETPVRLKATELYFNEVEAEMCVTTTPDYGKENVVGTYTAVAENAIDFNTERWTVTITADETEAGKVWIHPFCQFGGLPVEYINPIYATYDATAATLTIPMGQVLYEEPDYCMVVATTADFEEPNITDNVVATIEGDAIYVDALIGVGNTIRDEWWYQGLLGIVMRKELGQAYPIANIEKITREKPAVSDEYTFITPDVYTWSFQYQISETEFISLASTTTFEAGNTFDLSILFGEEGAGVTARDWTVSGFMEDLGFFEENGEPYDMTGFSYSLQDQYGLYEVLCLVNTQTGLCPIGQVSLPDPEGNQYNVDLLLGDLSGEEIYYPAIIADDEETLYFAGDQAVLWFIFENQAYLYAYLNDMVIEKGRAESQAAMRAKAITGAKPATIDQCIPVQIGEKKMVRR